MALEPNFVPVLGLSATFRFQGFRVFGSQGFRDQGARAPSQKKTKMPLTLWEEGVEG